MSTRNDSALGQWTDRQAFQPWLRRLGSDSDEDIIGDRWTDYTATIRPVAEGH
ncbi:hypothetical protein SAMN05444678_106138 [Sphingomonas sp. YR710]|jgi:hypothetical protein|uniref:hypothetical protein n=1 Tax=Sphingomonas sp. YR710 TaxID=1882773 RepID=UPI00087EDDF3|nr:hypothetical protein [Sphingomonas sp. YR710]SDC86027.1 hypothetical protein SAMN05444678_106138 [Sphingomonas sp. YR710]